MDYRGQTTVLSAILGKAAARIHSQNKEVDLLCNLYAYLRIILIKVYYEKC